MPDSLGPHLLGRRQDPFDDRDWDLAQLHKFRTPEVQGTPITPDSTLREVHDAAGSHWGWLWWASTMWKLIKGWFSGDQPTPTPPPPPPPPVTTPVLWDNPRTTLDQVEDGTCVGNGAAQFGNTSPINDDYAETDATSFYLMATFFDDGVQDSTLQRGATVRSGMKALEYYKRIAAYARVTDVESVKRWILNDGPALCGTNWLDGMWEVDENGFLYPRGNVAGGHCYLAIGYDPDADVFTFLNSWGPGWGVDGGRFHMHASDFETLMNDGGDVWTALELPLS